MVDFLRVYIKVKTENGSHGDAVSESASCPISLLQLHAVYYASVAFVIVMGRYQFLNRYNIDIILKV